MRVKPLLSKDLPRWWASLLIGFTVTVVTDALLEKVVKYETTAITLMTLASFRVETPGRVPNRSGLLEITAMWSEPGTSGKIPALNTPTLTTV